MLLHPQGSQGFYQLLQQVVCHKQQRKINRRLQELKGYRSIFTVTSFQYQGMKDAKDQKGLLLETSHG